MYSMLKKSIFYLTCNLTPNRPRIKTPTIFKEKIISNNASRFHFFIYLLNKNKIDLLKFAFKQSIRH